jgi:hypothetical protein
MKKRIKAYRTCFFEKFVDRFEVSESYHDPVSDEGVLARGAEVARLDQLQKIGKILVKQFAFKL